MDVSEGSDAGSVCLSVESSIITQPAAFRFLWTDTDTRYSSDSVQQDVKSWIFSRLFVRGTMHEVSHMLSVFLDSQKSTQVGGYPKNILPLGKMMMICQ